MGRTLIPNAKLGDRYRVSDETIRRWKGDAGPGFSEARCSDQQPRIFSRTNCRRDGSCSVRRPPDP